MAAVTLTDSLLHLIVYLLKSNIRMTHFYLYFFCFRFMVLTRRICGVLNASGKKPVEDLLKFYRLMKMLSFHWREESRALIKM